MGVKRVMRNPPGHKVPRLQSYHPVNGVPELDLSGGSSVARRLHRRAVYGKRDMIIKLTRMG